MTRDVCFFLPVRKGSQRIKSKNTRPFANMQGGLLELKLRQLIKCTSLTNIVLSTNDEVAMEVANRLDPRQDKIRVVARSEHLCADTTLLSDLIAHVSQTVTEEHIIWGHTTTPFVTPADYDRAIDCYFAKLLEGYDSLLSVMPLQNMLLDSLGNVVNYDAEVNRWPRTQDLPLLYEVNHAMFIASRSIYQQLGNRVGTRPYLYELDKIRSLDIDWEDQFLIAEAIYDKCYRDQPLSLGW